MDVLEFWPDYGSGPLWASGIAVDLQRLPLSEALRGRVVAWSADYEDDKLPIDGPGDADWLAEGKILLGDVRLALQDSYEVVVTEAWWD